MGKIKGKGLRWLQFTRHTSDPAQDIVRNIRVDVELAEEYRTGVSQGWATGIGSETFRPGYWDKVRVFTEDGWAEYMKENAGPF